MSVTIEQIILDVKRVCSKLKDREALGDSLIVETETVNKQVEAMKEVRSTSSGLYLNADQFSFQFQNDIEVLNKLARERSNNQMVHTIHQENPHIWEIQQENRQLKACLEDHQHALELIMQKYREHTQRQIKETKINFTAIQDARQAETIQLQAQKIQEMAAVMRKASEMGEEKVNGEAERISQLVTENQGLRELLEISRSYGCGRLVGEDKSTQTEESALATTTERATPPTATQPSKPEGS